MNRFPSSSSSVAVLIALCLTLNATTPWAAPTIAELQQFKLHFDRGIELYQAKRYAAAIPELLAAFERKQLPRLLYNIAQAHRRLGHTEDAIRYYEQYLRCDRDLTAEDRVEVEDTIKALRPPTPEPSPPAQQPGDVQQPGLQPSLPPEVEPGKRRPAASGPEGETEPSVSLTAGLLSKHHTARSPHRLSSGTWIGLSITGALGVAAAVLGGIAYQRSQTLLGTSYATVVDYSAKQQEVRRLAIATDTMVGGVVLSGGLTLALTLAWWPRRK